MEVILLERIGRLGQMGDIVRVKDGYARNFLLPQGKALRANTTNMARFEKDRVQLEARNLEQKSEAGSVAERISGQIFVAIRQAGDTGILYGSVSTRDIAETVTNGGCAIERRQVQLDRPIKTLGLHEVRLSLHPEVETKIQINVARTDEEAKRQARGEDVTAMRDDYDERAAEESPSTEEVFEDEALAQEAQSALSDDVQEVSDGEAEPDAAAGEQAQDSASDRETS